MAAFNCGPTEGRGFSGGCLNDDIAILTLERDIPEYAEVYEFCTGTKEAGSIFTMVGHGTTVNSVGGFIASAACPAVFGIGYGRTLDVLM